MPVLQARTPVIKQFYLPSSAIDAAGQPVPQEDQAWIKIDMGAITTGDIVNLQDEDNSTTRLAKMIIGRIVEWNYTEADGTPVPITFDNLCRIDADDFRYIIRQQINSGESKLSTEEKKS